MTGKLTGILFPDSDEEQESLLLELTDLDRFVGAILSSIKPAGKYKDMSLSKDTDTTKFDRTR